MKDNLYLKVMESKLLGLVAGLVVVIGIATYLSLPRTSPTLDVTVSLGNFTEFVVNSSCISEIIPYFVTIKYNGQDVNSAKVDLSLLDSSRQTIGKINLYYDSSLQSWKTAVGYTCLSPGTYYAFANASATIGSTVVTGSGEYPFEVSA
jgi:hypothetical protein